MSDLLCLGEPLCELNAQADGAFKAGFSGDVSNVAIAAARQGTDVGLISLVGDDPFGADLGRLWQRENVCADHVAIMRGQETGIYFVFHIGNGHNFVYRRRGSAASQITADDIPEAEIARARIFYSFGIGLWVSKSLRAAAFHAASVAKQRGLTVAFDPNLRTAL